MAVLDFDGVDDYVVSDVIGIDLTGAVSIVAVVELDSVSGFRCIISNNADTASPAIALEWDPNNDWLNYEVNGTGSVHSSTALPASNLTDTLFVAFTKAAGTTTGRFHFKNLTTLATTVHEPASATIGNPTSQSGGDIKIGNYGGALTDDYNGPIAMVAEFDSDLGDAGIDTILASRTTSAVYALTPKLLVECKQLTPVDLMGLTTFSAAVGATLTGPNPTNWTLDGVGTLTIPPIAVDYSTFPKMKLRRNS